LIASVRHSISDLIGWFAVVLGCLYIALAFRLKKFKQTA
jgi:hypothetical protein